MLPTKEEIIDRLSDEWYAKFAVEIPNQYINVIHKYAKWYAEQVIKHCVEIAKTTTKSILFDDPKEGRDTYMDISIIYKQSITNVINEL